MQLENLKRAIDDLKYQNEELIRTLSLKDEEIRYLQKDVATWREILDKNQQENDELKAIIVDIEEKNRKLNEKISQIIYNKAALYKEKTLHALRMSQSPEK